MCKDDKFPVVLSLMFLEGTLGWWNDTRIYVHSYNSTIWLVPSGKRARRYFRMHEWTGRGVPYRVALIIFSGDLKRAVSTEHLLAHISKNSQRILQLNKAGPCLRGVDDAYTRY